MLNYVIVKSCFLDGGLCRVRETIWAPLDGRRADAELQTIISRKLFRPRKPWCPFEF